MSRQRPRGMQQGSARWYRYWMRRWGKQIRSEAPCYHRPSLRGTAADTYERPWWMTRFEPYECRGEDIYLVRDGRRRYIE